MAGNKNRIIPQVPENDKTLRILIDSDTANEIDDLYAIVLALVSPDRFKIEGFVATHFSSSGGPDSTQRSYDLLIDLLKSAGAEGKYTVKKGSHPMQYCNTPIESEGVDFIIEKALEGDEHDPLWVVGLGAATNLASAILKAPEIIPKVRYVFHARSEYTWPERSVQFNVYGDIIAAKTLLESNVPLVWFDTGTHLYADYETTKKHVATAGNLGRFLHDYRDTNDIFKSDKKGFFDLGDIAFLLEPSLCKTEIVEAPTMTRYMYFDFSKTYGNMLRVYDIDVERTWDIFFNRLKTHK